MEHRSDCGAELEGKMIAVLLDQEEYPSNIGNVAAVSDRQILFLERVKHGLVHYRYAFCDVDDCTAIEYRVEWAWYRVVLAVISFLLAAALALLLVASLDQTSREITPLIVGIVATLTFGVRLVTSMHRHIISFELPDRILRWTSPAIDYRSKADAARAVFEFARQRGILREA